MKSPSWLLLGLLALIGALMLMQRVNERAPTMAIPATSPGSVDAIPLQEAVEPAVVPESAATPSLNLSEFAAKCFSDIRARNPRGRVLRLNANRLGDRCSGIVETRNGSGRWLFDWRDGSRWVREGELLMPPGWPPTLQTAGIPAAAFAADEIAARMADARELVGEQAHDDWLYEILWLPEPFSRQLTVVTLSDTRPEAGEYDVFSYYFDGERQLSEEEEASANEHYPLTRFELREDHNFKGPLYESTALAEAAVSLETDPDAAPDSALLKNANTCMDWLHKANEGSRVIRVGISIERCYFIQESAAEHDHFYLLTTSGDGVFDEGPALQIDVSELPNLMLDRSRVTMPRLRERLAQAFKADDVADVDQIAIVWLADDRVLWQFSRGKRVLAYLDERGASVDAPDQFPITRAEIAAGFPESRAALEVAVEE